MQEEYTEVRARIKEIAHMLEVEEPSKIYIDYYWCIESTEISRYVREHDMMILDKFVIDYGDEDLIDSLIVHECCHLKITGHGPDFQGLFKNIKPDVPFELFNHPKFSSLQEKLMSLGFLNNDTTWNPWNLERIPRRPINEDVYNYLVSQKSPNLL